MFPQREPVRCVSDGCMDNAKNTCIRCSKQMCDFHCASGGLFKQYPVEHPAGFNKIGYVCVLCIRPDDTAIPEDDNPNAFCTGSPVITLDFCIWLQKQMGDKKVTNDRSARTPPALPPELKHEAWPTNPQNGRFLCAPEHPMPRNAAGRWEHTNRRDDGECADSCCDYFVCLDCGHRWKEEVPQ
jgi:hypothetical protein